MFLAGYLVVWTAIGIGAFFTARALRALDPGWLAWDSAGPWVAGGAIVTAGLYQLTPLKSACLRHCLGAKFLSIHPAWRVSTCALDLWRAAACVGLTGVTTSVRKSLA